MYSLTPGYRVPAIQRGLSPAETLLTKLNTGAAGAVLMSAMVTPPPVWAFGVVGAAAGLLNVAPGPRSIGRWAAVGYRRLRERTAPDSVTERPGATMTWALYPEHGTMQDPLRRTQFHEAFSRALTFAGGQARAAGVQVHVTHHATVGDYTHHTLQLVTACDQRPDARRPRRPLRTAASRLVFPMPAGPSTMTTPPAPARGCGLRTDHRQLARALQERLAGPEMVRGGRKGWSGRSTS